MPSTTARGQQLHPQQSSHFPRQICTRGECDDYANQEHCTDAHQQRSTHHVRPSSRETRAD
eukprot:6481501-Amphidinium_carterae.1